MIYEILLMLYVLGTLWGLWLVFGKAGVASWKALVPVWNVVEWIRLCGKGWLWYLGFLVPGINIFMFLLLVVETAKVFRRGNFLEQTLAVLLPCVWLPLAGLKSNWVYHNPKEDPPAKVGELRDWEEAIVFALIAAVLIRGFVFELFSIPSSSMEKSLMVGDHLVVSKMAYGPRVIMTPLSLPLVHNSLGGATKSYLEWPQLPYYRFPGYTHVKRYDAVVFNFPAGDTILSAFPGCQYTYYQAVNECGRDSVLSGRAVVLFGGQWVPVGKVLTRPLDKREHYIKRCIGLPGENLLVKDGEVYIDGKHIELPSESQTTYTVAISHSMLRGNPAGLFGAVGVSDEDIREAMLIASDDTVPGSGGGEFRYVVPRIHLTRGMVSRLESYGAQVWKTESTDDSSLFPNLNNSVQSVDNFGPVHIPAKDEVVQLTMENLPMYRRIIESYEHNTLEVRNGRIYINGEATTTYTIKQDYYWMMGDNRHNSQDSRYWGFVPEDHIVGKAKRVLWSSDKDHGGIRLNRIFKNANDR